MQPPPAAQPPDVTTAVTFLRDRCSELQHALDHPEDRLAVLDTEPEAAHRWLETFAAARSLVTRTLLEELCWLHGKVTGRLARGGVELWGSDIEALVRARLVDELQERTDRAVRALQSDRGTLHVAG